MTFRTVTFRTVTFRTHEKRPVSGALSPSCLTDNHRFLGLSYRTELPAHFVGTAGYFARRTSPINYPVTATG